MLESPVLNPIKYVARLQKKKKELLFTDSLQPICNKRTGTNCSQSFQCCKAVNGTASCSTYLKVLVPVLLKIFLQKLFKSVISVQGRFCELHRSSRLLNRFFLLSFPVCLAALKCVLLALKTLITNLHQISDTQTSLN